MSNGPDSILVIDDEIQIRRFIRAGFEMAGYRVEEAASGTEGLRAATLGTQDLIILDLGLPDIDGAEVLERLRGWTEVALIVLSVRAGEAEKVKLLELGADDCAVSHSNGRALARAPPRCATIAKGRPVADRPVGSSSPPERSGSGRVSATPWAVAIEHAREARRQRGHATPAAAEVGAPATNRMLTICESWSQTAPEDRGD